MAVEDGAASLEKRRQKLANLRGEPIETVERSIINPNGSLYVNIPDKSVAMLGLDNDENVQVERWDDRLVVRPSDSDA